MMHRLDDVLLSLKKRQKKERNAEIMHEQEVRKTGLWYND